MAQDIFLIRTDEARTPSGLILPNKEGLIMAVIGTLATDLVRERLSDVSDASIEPHEAAVLVQVPVFMNAARDLLQKELRPPAE